MQCVIFVAGDSSRMRLLTTDRPPIARKQILQHLIESVRKSGINDIILILGYKAASIKSYFKEEKLTYVIQKKTT